MPAYAYLRKSSVRVGERELSHEVQEAAVRELAERNGHDDLVILSDWDKSGRLGADKRPGYAALLTAVKTSAATAIYSYSLSRLGRSLPELSRLVTDCAGRGIPVRLYVDSVDTSTASGRFLTNVLGAVADFEADVASERTLAGIARRRAAGERLGARAYGDGATDDVAAVRDAVREAGTYSGAARLLNERGVAPRNSKRGWWPSAVSVVMRRLEPEIVVGASRRGPGGVTFTLAKLLRCPMCGTRLTGITDRGGSRVRYACRLGSVRPHQRVTISEHLILPAIVDEASRLRTPDAVEGEDEPNVRAELDARRERILDMFEAGHIDRDERERRLAAVYRALEQLDARRIVMNVPTIDWTWPPATLNVVLTALFERIDLDPATFQPVGFTWAVPQWRS